MAEYNQNADLFDSEIMQDNKAKISVIETKNAKTQDSSEDENDDQTPSGRKGRPRSEKSRESILKATNALLLHQSVQELSIEAIAKKAKVGKTTIYRWWPNKTAVVMDALIEQPGMSTAMPTPKNNSDAVIMQLEKLIRLLASKNGETIAQLFSEAQGDEQSLKIFDENFLSPLIDAIEFSIQEGQKSGEFDPKINSKMAVDMLCGPVFFRLLSRPADLNEKFRDTWPKEAARLISA